MKILKEVKQRDKVLLFKDFEDGRVVVEHWKGSQYMASFPIFMYEDADKLYKISSYGALLLELEFMKIEYERKCL